MRRFRFVLFSLLVLFVLVTVTVTAPAVNGSVLDRSPEEYGEQFATFVDDPSTTAGGALPRLQFEIAVGGHCALDPRRQMEASEELFVTTCNVAGKMKYKCPNEAEKWTANGGYLPPFTQLVGKRQPNGNIERASLWGKCCGNPFEPHASLSDADLAKMIVPFDAKAVGGLPARVGALEVRVDRVENKIDNLPSAPLSSTTPCKKPEAVTGSFSDLTETSVQLAGSVSDNTATAVIQYRRQGDAVWSTAGVGTAAGLINLPSKTTFEYRMVAQNSCGTATGSVATFTTATARRGGRFWCFRDPWRGLVCLGGAVSGIKLVQKLLDDPDSKKCYDGSTYTCKREDRPNGPTAVPVVAAATLSFDVSRFREMRRGRERWIPAYAGMTGNDLAAARVEGVDGMRIEPARETDRLLDSRLRGNDREGAPPRAPAKYSVGVIAGNGTYGLVLRRRW